MRASATAEPVVSVRGLVKKVGRRSQVSNSLPELARVSRPAEIDIAATWTVTVLNRHDQIDGNAS
jgi:hypothetical protein